MKLKSLSIIFVFALGLFGCNNAAKEAEMAKQQEEQQTLWDEAMAIHDAVMPMMTTVEKMKAFLTDPANFDGVSDESKQVAAVALADLEQADKSMWDWMNNLQKLEDLRKDKTHEEILAYLTEQKTEMEGIKTALNQAATNGKKAIYKINPNAK